MPVTQRLLPLILQDIATSIQASFDPGSLQNWTAPALISFGAITDKAWLAMPAFVLPEWKWEAVLFIVPVAIAPAIEHFGDVLAIGSITGKDYVEDPGIENTMLGDGIATVRSLYAWWTAEHHLFGSERSGGAYQGL